MTRLTNRPNCEAAWSRTVSAALAGLAVDPLLGLDTETAVARRRHFGPNALQAAMPRHVLLIIVDQFRSVVILLLAAAGALAILFSEHTEGLAIFAVVLINASIGFVTEWRAIRSMEALKDLGHVDTVVLRDGSVDRIAAEQLVPGDIVILESGDIVSADMRLIDAANLQADESTFTGESLPVTKHTDPLAAGTRLMEQSNMVFKGTAITRGSGRGVVVGTGLQTELGRISELVMKAEPQETPLEKRLDTLAEKLAIVVLVMALFVAVAGVLAGRGLFLAIEVAIALAVAAIPEGLPIVATIALARGMWRMAQRNALIARLSAVETLGATSVILTDKTGTLTENRMTVTEVRLAGADVAIESGAPSKTWHFFEHQQKPAAATYARIDELLTAAALCNNAALREQANDEFQAIGDPTEIALLVAASRRGILREDALARSPELMEISFDPQTKRMATLHKTDTGTLVAVKGAPESVIPSCTSVRTAGGEKPLGDKERDAWLGKAHDLGNRGLRTLAVATKTGTDGSDDPYDALVLLGVVGLEDPARAGVKEAIERCHAAGIAVVMVTGDHLATARNIAVEVSIVAEAADSRQFINGDELDELTANSGPDELLAARVIARAAPEQKLKLIQRYQRQGCIVAMTGDGVNDAPALKKADIGIAMGKRGTSVAKEAAHMVLLDDEFATILGAIAQGRAIYANIRKFVVYLLSCNISEVMIVSLATIAGAPLPLLPLQILFLNLVTDVFPALALGVGEGSPSLMKRTPRRPDEPLLTRSLWLRIALHGAVISGTVLGAMAIAIYYLRFDTGHAVTVSFCTLAFAQLWHVFNMRDNMRHVISNEITRNPWVWLAIAICCALILAAIYTPLTSELLSLTDPGVTGWLVILPMSFVPLVLAPLVRLASR